MGAACEYLKILFSARLSSTKELNLLLLIGPANSSFYGISEEVI